jgi:uncharacterized protein
LIDADSHVMEPGDLWERYLEPRYRDRAIRIVETDGVEQLVMGGDVILAGTLAGLGGAHVHPRNQLFNGTMRYADGCHPASYDPSARISLYDDWGVSSGVVFPTIGILPFPNDDNELASAYCRAYNTWQSEFAADAAGRVLPIAHVNLGDLDTAIAELERCLALGFKGVFVAPEPVGDIRPGDPHFDPFWQRCAEAGVPACLHVVVRFGGAGVPYEPWLRAGAGMVFGFSLGAPGQIIPTVASMVLDGVFDRVPSLKVLCVEAGCGWAAHLMDRLDEKYELLSFMGTPLQRRPSEYLESNVWYVAEPEERSIGAMLELVGEDRILWGSDFPHIDSKLDAADLIRASIRSLSATRQAAVLGANAAKVFNLPTAPLTSSLRNRGLN